MVALFGILAFVLTAVAAGIALLYYFPFMFDPLVVGLATDVIHETRLSQNITFGVMVFFAVLALALWVLMPFLPSIRLARRRKKLLQMFEGYGTRFQAEDAEIEF